jgi:fumarate reductase flavoprotein subunit
VRARAGPAPGPRLGRVRRPAQPGLSRALRRAAPAGRVGAIRQAGSWAELEKLCNLPDGSLERENAAIDAARAAGQPDRLGRRFEGTEPLQAPFCALRVTGALFHTQGGLAIDDHAQVLRSDGTPLPNLFAGGGAARSIAGPDVTGYLPAVGIAMAITLGALAGDAAARLALSRDGTA